MGKVGVTRDVISEACSRRSTREKHPLPGSSDCTNMVDIHVPHWLFWRTIVHHVCTETHPLAARAKLFSSKKLSLREARFVTGVGLLRNPIPTFGGDQSDTSTAARSRPHEINTRGGEFILYKHGGHPCAKPHWFGAPKTIVHHVWTKGTPLREGRGC